MITLCLLLVIRQFAFGDTLDEIWPIKKKCPDWRLLGQTHNDGQAPKAKSMDNSANPDKNDDEDTD